MSKRYKIGNSPVGTFAANDTVTDEQLRQAGQDPDALVRAKSVEEVREDLRQSEGQVQPKRYRVKASGARAASQFPVDSVVTEDQLRQAGHNPDEMLRARHIEAVAAGEADESDPRNYRDSRGEPSPIIQNLNVTQREEMAHPPGVIPTSPAMNEPAPPPPPPGQPRPRSKQTVPDGTIISGPVPQATPTAPTRDVPHPTREAGRTMERGAPGTETRGTTARGKLGQQVTYVINEKEHRPATLVRIDDDEDRATLQVQKANPTDLANITGLVSGGAANAPIATVAGVEHDPSGTKPGTWH